MPGFHMAVFLLAGDSCEPRNLGANMGVQGSLPCTNLPCTQDPGQNWLFLRTERVYREDNNVTKTLALGKTQW